jgi:hypothetical protein
MSRTSYPLKLPHSIKAAAARLAREDGVSLNQWIAVAVAEKVGVTETAADLLHRQSQGAQPSDMLAFLDRAADEPPTPGDAV